jgi:hypothetical protein
MYYLKVLRSCLLHINPGLAKFLCLFTVCFYGNLLDDRDCKDKYPKKTVAKAQLGVFGHHRCPHRISATHCPGKYLIVWL